MASTPLTATDPLGDAGAGHGPSDAAPRPRSDADAAVERRRAAEAAAAAAEARAAAAAVQAKAAIAAAARAAAAADEAARVAEIADAELRAAAEAETRAVPVIHHDAAEATTPVGLVAAYPGVRVDGWRTPPVPAPRAASRHGAPGAEGPDTVVTAGPDGSDDPRTGLLPRVSRHSADGPDGGAASPGPLSDGRAARRAAAAETAVMAPLPADHDPRAADDLDEAADPDADLTADLDAGRHDDVDLDADGTDDPPTVVVEPSTRRARRLARAQGLDDRYEDDEPAAPRPGRAARRRRGWRRPTQPLLVAAAAGGVLALAGVAFGTGVVGPSPQPAAVVESQPPAVPVLPEAVGEASPSEADLTERTADYLRELREAGVPTSRAGVAETGAAELVCDELADGVEADRIARALPASLPTVSRSQAADLVEVAQEHFCV